MRKVKILVITDSSDECTIICEDGGITTAHHNGEHLLSTYHGERIESPVISWDEIWERMAEVDQYNGDWDGDITKITTIYGWAYDEGLPAKDAHDQEVYEDAACWMYMATDAYEFEYIYKDFSEVSIDFINDFIQFEPENAE